MGNDGRDTELPETGDICRCVMVVDWTITAYSVALIARALAMIPPHAVRAGVAQRIFHCILLGVSCLWYLISRHGCELRGFGEH